MAYSDPKHFIKGVPGDVVAVLAGFLLDVLSVLPLDVLTELVHAKTSDLDQKRAEYEQRSRIDFCSQGPML